MPKVRRASPRQVTLPKRPDGRNRISPRKTASPVATDCHSCAVSSGPGVDAVSRAHSQAPPRSHDVPATGCHSTAHRAATTDALACEHAGGPWKSERGVHKPGRDRRFGTALMLGAPLRTGTPHIVQFRPVVVEHGLFQRAPERQDSEAHARTRSVEAGHGTRPQRGHHDVSEPRGGSGSPSHDKVERVKKRSIARALSGADDGPYMVLAPSPSSQRGR